MAYREKLFVSLYVMNPDRDRERERERGRFCGEGVAKEGALCRQCTYNSRAKTRQWEERERDVWKGLRL